MARVWRTLRMPRSLLPHTIAYVCLLRVCMIVAIALSGGQIRLGSEPVTLQELCTAVATIPTLLLCTWRIAVRRTWLLAPGAPHLTLLHFFGNVIRLIRNDRMLRNGMMLGCNGQSCRKQMFLHVCAWSLEIRAGDAKMPARARAMREVGMPPLTMCELRAVHDDDLAFFFPSSHGVQNLLTLAAKCGEGATVRSLVALGAPLEAYPQHGSRALAARTHGAHAQDAHAQETHETHDVTLEESESARADSDAETAVVVAREAGHEDVVRFLLGAGARPRSAELREDQRQRLKWELVRLRTLAAAQRAALTDATPSVRDDARLLRSLRVVSGVHGHCPDGPFGIIMSHL